MATIARSSHREDGRSKPLESLFVETIDDVFPKQLLEQIALGLEAMAYVLELRRLGELGRLLHELESGLGVDHLVLAHGVVKHRRATA